MKDAIYALFADSASLSSFASVDIPILPGAG